MTVLDLRVGWMIVSGSVGFYLICVLSILQVFFVFILLGFFLNSPWSHSSVEYISVLWLATRTPHTLQGLRLGVIPSHPLPLRFQPMTVRTDYFQQMRQQLF